MKTIAVLLLLSAGLASASTEEKFNKTFPASPEGSLVVDVGFGSIEITSSPEASEVKVDVWRKITRSSSSDEEAYLKEYPVETTQDGKTVTVHTAGKSSFSWSWWWFTGWHSRNEARYVVTIPEHFSAQLKTAGGSISVTGVTGNVKADTSGGSLTFTRIHGSLNGGTSGGSITVNDCDGEIHIGTSGGGISGTGGSGSLHAHTSGGGITVKNFKGPIDIGTSGGGLTVEAVQGQIKGRTSGGSIHAVVPAPIPGDVDLSTSGGSVHLLTAANAAFVLDAETSGGGVSSDLPVAVQGSIQRSHLQGPVNGGGPSIRLHSSGGSIHVQKQ